MKTNNKIFDFTVCNMPDEEIFYKQCKALEDNIPGLKKVDLLHDVDGSLVQIYSHPRGEITVSNDFYVGALYVQADFNLLPYFKKQLKVLAQ